MPSENPGSAALIRPLGQESSIIGCQSGGEHPADWSVSLRGQQRKDCLIVILVHISPEQITTRPDVVKK